MTSGITKLMNQSPPKFTSRAGPKNTTTAADHKAQAMMAAASDTMTRNFQRIENLDWSPSFPSLECR
jgi:hypothetical protein